MQSFSVKEVGGQLICQKFDHKDPILLVIMEDSVPFNDKFLCQKCLQVHRGVTKMTPINQVIDVMKEKITNMNAESEQISQSTLEGLKDFQQKMNHIKTLVIQNFEELQSITDQWKKDLEFKTQQLDLLTIFKEFESKDLNNNKVKELIKNNRCLFTKIEMNVKKLLDFNKLNMCYDGLKNLITESEYMIITKRQQLIKNNDKNQHQYMNIQQPQLKVSQVQLIQSVKQDQYSLAMAFNHTGTTMVSGCEKDLKVWKFKNGQLCELKILTGHTICVNCIVFSKKLNWFASGSRDNTIRCWKEQENDNWICSKIGQKHQNTVNCLILNNNEDEIVSCSKDNTIIVWKVNCQTNLLDYYYTLDLKHTGYIYCISSNELETSLVSCSRDNSIILWKKDQNKKWIYQHHITNDDYGKRICFINNNQFVWQQYSQGITHIYEIYNEKLLGKSKFNIQVNQETKDEWLFPTIYNKQKQIIIQRHNKYVYLLQKQEDGKLLIAHDPIDCNNNANYGTLTMDGEYLVIWNYETREFRVYNIKYK